MRGFAISKRRSACLLFALVALASGAAAQDLDEAFDRDVLIIDAAFACLRFDIWLAVDREQQNRGLMHVREMPATSGMLFVYERNATRSMWMKNTYISLDIAFARDDGRIINIERNTEPLSELSIRSSEPATYVLELNAGVTEAMSIEPGSRLLWGPTLGEGVVE